MPEEPVFDHSIQNGQWPIEFSGGWIDISPDPITGDTVASLYLDDRKLEGTININSSRKFELPLPQAYISWKNDGTCKEIFVDKEYRNKGIGTKLCAWARSYCYTNNILFCAPDKMSRDAIFLFQNICNIYGEVFTDPEEASILNAYGYWGYLV